MKKISMNILMILSVLSMCFAINIKVEAKVKNSYIHTKSNSPVPYAFNHYGAHLYYHYFDGNIPVYCTQWDFPTESNAKYTPYNKGNITDQTKYIIGKAISLINADSKLASDQKYTYATWVANCSLNATGLNGSTCHETWNGYQSYLTSAKKAVNEMQLCSGTNTSGCFNSDAFKLILSGNNYTLSKIGDTSDFISNKITLTGMLASYGGTGTSYKIEVNSCPKGSTCTICEDDKGSKNCASTKSFKNRSEDYSFYVKVTNGTANANVKIKASGSNSATYPYAYIYSHTDNNQKLTIVDEIEVDRNVYKVLTLTVPSDHTVTATKVDENGEDLPGAKFRIYRADADGNMVKELVNNKDGEASTTYTETIDIENWANYKYCFEELEAPSGYILGEGDKAPFCITPSKGVGSSTCYTNDENHTEVDIKNCDSYSYYCSSDSETLNTNICQSKLNPTTKEPTVCEEGYTYSDLDKLCHKSDASRPEEQEKPPTVQTESQGPTIDPEESGGNAIPKCDEGELLEGTCYVCSQGDTLSQEDKMCIHESEAKCKDSDSKDVDSSYCKNRPNYELVNITSTGNISFVRTNRKNAVSISKTDITGEEELYGARMKICTTKPDEKLDCDLATITMSGQCSTSDLENGTCKNVDDTTMEQSIIWTSGIAPKTWRGLVTNKEYYLVETVAPLGYKISQYTSFSIKEDGTVISSDTTVQDEKILVKNDLTDLTVVKQDSKTKKELSGAKLLLCMMGEDENGKMKIIKPEEGTGCVVASLNDGTLAEWTTDGKPINITGLAAGTYTLTEEEAPDDYDMAEDIVFTLRQDGTLVDANDKVIKDNKIIMYDDEMEQVPTGDVLIIVIAILAIVSLGGGMFYYQKYYKKKKLA